MLILFFTFLIVGIVLLNKASNEYTKERNYALMHHQKPINMWLFLATKHPLTLLMWIVIAIIMITIAVYN